MEPDAPLPTRWRVGVAVALVLGLSIIGGFAYYVTQPCWPWQEVGSFAGGTTCDGEPARFDTD